MPEHVKSGRFGEWLREVKDWNLSRERYWGAPLPIWECKACGHTEVVGGLDELDRLAGGSKNKYWAMRHGESENVIFKIVDSGDQNIAILRRAARNRSRRLQKRSKKTRSISFSHPTSSARRSRRRSSRKRWACRCITTSACARSISADFPESRALK